MYSLRCIISPLTDIILSQNNELYRIIPSTEHFLIYKLETPKRLLLQKLLVAQLVKNLSASLETQMFITEWKRAVDLCFSLAS